MEKLALNRLAKKYWKLSSIARKRVHDAGVIRSPKTYARGLNKGSRRLAEKHGLTIRPDGKMSPGDSYHVINKDVVNAGMRGYEPLGPATALRHEVYEGMAAKRLKNQYGHRLGPDIAQERIMGQYKMVAPPNSIHGRRLIRHNIVWNNYDTLTKLKYKYGKVKSKNISKQLHANASNTKQTLWGYSRVTNTTRHQGADVMARDSNMLRSLPHQNITRTSRHLDANAPVMGDISVMAGIGKKRFGVDKFSRRDIRKLQKFDDNTDYGNIWVQRY